MMQLAPITLATRFRGFLPVVIDVETGGFNPQTDALLEIAAVLIEMRSDGTLTRGETHRYHVTPFPGVEPRTRVARRQRHRSASSAAARRFPRRTRCSGYSARSATPCAPPIARAPCWSATTRSSI